MNTLISISSIAAVMAVGLAAKPQQPIFIPAPDSPFAVGIDPLSVAVADMNADGKLDILTANNGSNNVTVLLGRKL